jgi:hypothetical protein
VFGAHAVTFGQRRDGIHDVAHLVRDRDLALRAIHEHARVGAAVRHASILTELEPGAHAEPRQRRREGQ